MNSTRRHRCRRRGKHDRYNAKKREKCRNQNGSMFLPVGSEVEQLQERPQQATQCGNRTSHCSQLRTHNSSTTSHPFKRSFVRSFVQPFIGRKIPLIYQHAATLSRLSSRRASAGATVINTSAGIPSAVPARSRTLSVSASVRRFCTGIFLPQSVFFFRSFLSFFLFRCCCWFSSWEAHKPCV